jgi:CysZ protein
VIRFLRETILAIHTYYKAIQFVGKQNMWINIFAAAFFNLFAFVFVGIIAWLYTAQLINWFNTLLSFPEDWGFWSNLLRYTLGFLIRFIIFLAYFSLFKYIILFVFAPVLALISEKTQNILQNEKRPIKLQQLVNDIIRGMFVAVILIGLQASSWMILIVLCIAVPFLAPFYAVFLFVSESFFFGASMIDYRNEYFHLTVSESLKKIFSHKGLAFGNGLFLNLFMLIPVIGVLIGPSLAVISAGIAANETFEN